MEAKDTVMSAGDLCRLVCQEHRSSRLEAKNCSGSDCEVCQLTKQAEISFKAGMREAALQLRAKIGGIDEFNDYSPEGMRGFRQYTLMAISDLLKEWGDRVASSIDKGLDRK